MELELGVQDCQDLLVCPVFFESNADTWDMISSSYSCVRWMYKEVKGAGAGYG